ncbi:MAG: DUF4003 family protein [Lachnospiraceae bacterium]|nr:DUF4003 family protein [Lachnospiraceae bacterium]
MNATLSRLTKRFIDDFNTAKKVYKLDGNYAASSYAASLLGSTVPIDEERLKEAKKLISRHSAGLVNIKGTLAKEVAAAAVAESTDPDYAAQKINELYASLRKICSGSDFFGVPASIIYKSVQNVHYEQVIEKVNAVYKGLRKKHPFLTSYEDIVGCTLMALTDKSVDDIVADSEACFDILKKKFIVNNNAQTVACVLSLFAGTAEERCDKTIEVEKVLKKARISFGDRSLGTLATIAMVIKREDLQSYISDVREVSDALKSVRGLGNFGVGRQFRNLIAAAIVTVAYSEENKTNIEASAVNGIVSTMFTQHLIVVACMSYAITSASNNIHISSSSDK